MSPLSDEAQKLYHNAPAMLFAAHAAKIIDREQIDRLGELLGVVWTRESALAMLDPTPPDPKDKESNKPRERMIIPLLTGVNPKVIDVIRKGFGSPHGIDAPGWYRQNRGEVVEGYDMPRDEFVRLASLFTPLIPKAKY